MKRIVIVLLGVLMTVPVSLHAKGITTRITVRDLASGATVEITDRAITEQFNVWAGRGTYSAHNGGPEQEGSTGFIVDWTGAAGDRPEGLRRFEVSFYVVRPRATTESLAYVVGYEFDPAARAGFVYFPGRGDQHFRLNVASIHRRVEGQWFRASRAWQDAIVSALAAR